MNTISCLFGMQIQREELAEGLPESNSAMPPPPLAGARPLKAEAPNQTLQTRLCLRYQTVAAVSQTTRKGRHGPVGPKGGMLGKGAVGGREAGGVTSLTSAHFHLEITREVRLRPKHGRQLMRWEEEEEEESESVPGAGRG